MISAEFVIWSMVLIFCHDLSFGILRRLSNCGFAAGHGSGDVVAPPSQHPKQRRSTPSRQQLQDQRRWTRRYGVLNAAISRTQQHLKNDKLGRLVPGRGSGDVVTLESAAQLHAPTLSWVQGRNQAASSGRHKHHSALIRV
jgi:hypothetical protein